MVSTPFSLADPAACFRIGFGILCCGLIICAAALLLDKMDCKYYSRYVFSFGGLWFVIGAIFFLFGGLAAISAYHHDPSNVFTLEAGIIVLICSSILRVLLMLLQRTNAIKSQIGGTFAYVLGWLSGAISLTLLTVLAVTISVAA